MSSASPPPAPSSPGDALLVRTEEEVMYGALQALQQRSIVTDATLRRALGFAVSELERVRSEQEHLRRVFDDVLAQRQRAGSVVERLIHLSAKTQKCVRCGERHLRGEPKPPCEECLGFLCEKCCDAWKASFAGGGYLVPPHLAGEVLKLVGPKK